MKFIVRTYKIDLSRLYSSFKIARLSFFCNSQKNKTLSFEILGSLKKILFYFRSSFFEIITNITFNFNAKYKRSKELIQNSILENKEKNHYKFILQSLNTSAKITFNENDFTDTIKENKPSIFLSNHPYPPLDAVSILSIINDYRTDVFLVVNANNHMVDLYPELSKNTLKVQSSNRTSVLRNCINLLNQGKSVLFFPAGQCSKALNWDEEITDPIWYDGVGLIVNYFIHNNIELCIFPIFIENHYGSEINSILYQKALLNSPHKICSALQYSYLNPPPEIKLKFGKIISSLELNEKGNKELTLQLRNKVYILESHKAIAKNRIV